MDAITPLNKKATYIATVTEILGDYQAKRIALIDVKKGELAQDAGTAFITEHYGSDVVFDVVNHAFRIGEVMIKPPYFVRELSDGEIDVFRRAENLLFYPDGERAHLSVAV